MSYLRVIGPLLVRGLLWGVLIAALNILVFPLLFIVGNSVEETLSARELRWFMLRGLRDVFIIMIHAFRLFSIPSIAGACILAVSGHFLMSGHSWLGRYACWLGAIVGVAVALSDSALLSSVVGGLYLVPRILLGILQVIVFALIGQRQARSYSQVS